MNYFIIAALLLPIVTASKETSIACGGKWNYPLDFVFIQFSACLMIINEVDKAVRAVDPRKKITVGSFRVDPKGNQDINEVDYSFRNNVPIY